MEQTEYYVITGAAGFIGSVLVGYLNNLGFENLVLVDDFSIKEKSQNLMDKKYAFKVHRDQFLDWLEDCDLKICGIFHLGARTDTTLMDVHVFKTLNLRYSRSMWEYCAEFNIPLVYASSAATYGDGALGYKDDETLIPELKPLNPYGDSKQKFDVWALEQKEQPPFWAGLKFFNVYGPNEYHKERMASVILHAYNKLHINDNKITLFRSHNPKYKDGEQMRDFIYVFDVVKVCVWLMETQPQNGIFNLGTGKARTFNDLAKSVFKALNIKEQIEYIDTPEDIRDNYQYYTEADMSKLKAAGYSEPFISLEDGVMDYVNKFLKEKEYY
ncbi:MAG TPA: ADP-glyceromanno-heptose 6-epimerase [Edaphocola sp.]|nr:ADP-glyceromanno-heptose 6-epimerase [Edaphocola sp.]